MKKLVKTLATITTFCVLYTSLSAQLKFPVASPISADVKKVIEDYPNRFINLMGEVITEHPQSTDYRCNFKVNGAEESFITRYSAKKEVCSWEALMLTTENFEKAKQKFKSLYNQLNNLAINIGNNKSIRLTAKYEAPAEEKKFASIVFNVEPVAEKITGLKAELSLQFYAPMEWKVKIMVYDRERADAERGSSKEQ